MSDRELADIVCRALLAIVAGLRKRYNLPEYRGIMVVLQEQVLETPKETLAVQNK